MQRLEVSGAVRPLQWPFGVKGLMYFSVPKHTVFTKSEVLTAADGDSDFLGCYAVSTGK